MCSWGSWERPGCLWAESRLQDRLVDPTVRSSTPGFLATVVSSAQGSGPAPQSSSLGAGDRKGSPGDTAQTSTQGARLTASMVGGGDAGSLCSVPHQGWPGSCACSVRTRSSRAGHMGQGWGGAEKEARSQALGSSLQGYVLGRWWLELCGRGWRQPLWTHSGVCHYQRDGEQGSQQEREREGMDKERGGGKHLP